MDGSILTNYPIKSNCLRHGCDDVLGEIAMSRSILSNGTLTCRCWVAWMVQVQSPHLSQSLLVWSQKLLQYMQYTTNLQYNKPTICCRYLCSSMRSYSSISTLRGNPITGSGQFSGSQNHFKPILDTISNPQNSNTILEEKGTYAWKFHSKKWIKCSTLNPTAIFWRCFMYLTSHKPHTQNHAEIDHHKA